MRGGHDTEGNDVVVVTQQREANERWQGLETAYTSEAESVGLRG